MAGESADEVLVEQLYPPDAAERSYVAALLGRDDANEVMWRSRVEPAHFADGEQRAVLAAMIEIRDRGEKVCHLTVAEELANQRLEFVMWNASNGWVNPGFAEFFAEQVMVRYRRRSVGDLGAVLRGVADATPNSELDSAVEEAVAVVMSEPAVRDFVRTDATLAERAFTPRPADRVVLTPWPRLNKAIKGFRRGQLYTLSGDTGSGKSAVALQFAHAISRYGTCLYFTMEMSEGEMQDRLIAQQTAVALDLVERQSYPVGPVRDRVERFVLAHDVPIIFDETTSVSASEVRRIALGTDGLAGVVIDQLALMDLGDRKGQNLADVIARTTSALKAMAADLDIPVILLSQLNREAARSGRPTRHHLYGSSAIANDAGSILILHRDDPKQPEALQMIVDKNRHGEEGSFDLRWEGAFVRAVDPSAH